MVDRGAVDAGFAVIVRSGRSLCRGGMAADQSVCATHLMRLAAIVVELSIFGHYSPGVVAGIAS